MRYKVHEFQYKGMRGLYSEKNQQILEQFMNALEGRVVSIIDRGKFLFIIEVLDD